MMRQLQASEMSDPAQSRPWSVFKHLCFVVALVAAVCSACGAASYLPFLAIPQGVDKEAAMLRAFLLWVAATLISTLITIAICVLPRPRPPEGPLKIP
jgi:hypothetical protein